MPLPVPNLDDRSFDQLAAEARALIPILYPSWTNHNPTDPGIVLIELLAYLTEMLLFQVDQIPPANTLKFLGLLNGPGWTPPPDGDLGAAIRQTIRDLREPYRAVTPGDYEYLALHAWPQSEAAAQLGNEAAIRRVRCVPRRNFSEDDPALRSAPAPAHVSLVVMPEPGSEEDYPEPSPSLTTALWSFFEPRRLLTVRHHVVGPEYVPVGIGANLALHEDAPAGDALREAREVLVSFFDPLRGGQDEKGWPFGRDVYASEAYAILERVSLVDYVEDVRLAGPTPIRSEEGQVIGIRLDAHQLVRLQRLDLVAYDVYGRTYQEPAVVP
jgi:hypothetical protein